VGNLILYANEMKQNEENFNLSYNKPKFSLFKVDKKSNNQKESHISIPFNQLKEDLNWNSFNYAKFFDDKCKPETPKFNPEFEISNEVIVPERKQEIPNPSKIKSEYLNLSAINTNLELQKSIFQQ